MDVLRYAVQGKVGQPCLVVDADVLDDNVEAVKRHSEEIGKEVRLVVKSLPSLELLKRVRTGLGHTKRFMVFHVPFVLEICRAFPDGDVLLGKPLPVDAFRIIYGALGGEIGPITWLVDSMERMKSYAQVAWELDLKSLKICLEVDIGLHRGGFQDLSAALYHIQQEEPRFKLTGLMGYEPHAVKNPGILGGRSVALSQALRVYRSFHKQVVEMYSEEEVSRMRFNCGGSQTFFMFGKDGESDFVNELSIGTALLKPADFDLPTLTGLSPALFLVTPVLKVLDNPQVPLVNAAITWLLKQLNIFPRKTCFIYGGNWLAQPCFPEGMQHVSLFGPSSNQECYSIPNDTKLVPDDLVVFRPTQSESILLQFGNLIVISSNMSRPRSQDGNHHHHNGSIIATWPVFTNSTIISHTVI